MIEQSATVSKQSGATGIGYVLSALAIIGVNACLHISGFKPLYFSPGPDYLWLFPAYVIAFTVLGFALGFVLSSRLCTASILIGWVVSYVWMMVPLFFALIGGLGAFLFAGAVTYLVPAIGTVSTLLGFSYARYHRRSTLCWLAIISGTAAVLAYFAMTVDTSIFTH